jgi:two-component system sensor histidine kinase/response regulator
MAETMKSGARILVVDDEMGIRLGVQRALRAQGHAVDLAEDLAKGHDCIAQEHYDLVLLDVMMPGGSGIDLIGPIHERDPDTVCIIITGFATIELAVDAIKRGAYDFVSKPFTVDQLLLAVNQGLERRALTLEARRLATIEEQAEALTRDKAELERLDRAKSQLMLQVAHELRAPTAAVQSYVGLILAGYITESELKPTLFRIQERLQQTLDLVSDLLDLARLKQVRGSARAQATPQDMAHILRGVVDLLREQAMQKKQDLQIEIREEPTIVAQPNHLRQIWMNLLSNAIKYTPDGGRITVTLGLDERPNHTAGSFLFGRVEDTGIGIASSDLPNLFTEFFRTDQAKESGQIGTGLGLAIVKQIVDSYDCQIVVESELGKGTRVSFFLPLEPPPPVPS